MSEEASTGAEGATSEVQTTEGQVDAGITSGNPDTGTAPIVKQANEAVKEAVRKMKVKYDDETEEDVDEDEVIKSYRDRKNHSKAADKKMREAAELRKQAEEFINLVKKDPRKLLQHESVGVDLKQFAEDIMAEYMEEQLMSPQEKETRDMKQKLSQYEQEKKASEEAAAKADHDAQTQHYMQEFDKQFTEVLSTSGLPKTNHTVSRLAYYMQQALNQGFENVKPADVVPLVKEDYINDIKALFGAADGEVLQQIMGDELLEKASKAYMGKIKTAQKKVGEKKEGVVAKREEQPARKYMNKDEWRAAIAERTGHTVD